MVNSDLIIYIVWIDFMVVEPEGKKAVLSQLEHMKGRLIMLKERISA